jgi:hypothetical protein
MSVEKKEPVREGSEESMDVTPEAEEAGAAQENAATQKRKGGRKPVSYPSYATPQHAAVLTHTRSMPLLRNASNETVRHRQPSEKDEPSILSNSKRPFEFTKPTCTICRRPIAALQMNVLC